MSSNTPFNTWCEYIRWSLLTLLTEYDACFDVLKPPVVFQQENMSEYDYEKPRSHFAAYAGSVIKLHVKEIKDKYHDNAASSARNNFCMMIGHANLMKHALCQGWNSCCQLTFPSEFCCMIEFHCMLLMVKGEQKVESWEVQ